MHCFFVCAQCFVFLIACASHVLIPSTMLTDTGLLHRDMAPQVCKKGRIFSLDDSGVSCVSE